MNIYVELPKDYFEKKEKKKPTPIGLTIPTFIEKKPKPKIKCLGSLRYLI